MTDKVTLRHLLRQKAAGEPIVALGVYDAVVAELAEAAGVDVVMTGPSGPMCLFGHANAAAIPFDEQLLLLQSVSRTVTRPLIVAHLPFLSYTTADQALASARRLIAEGGAEAVKLDAVAATAPIVKTLVDAGIPVMAHVGLQASRKVAQSGYRLQGRTAAEALRLLGDMRALTEAGVFGFVAELVPGELCAELARRLPVPVIGLGSGAGGDGVCVIAGDALNFLASPRPANAAGFTDIAAPIAEALAAYRDAVRAGTYPTAAQTPRMTVEQALAFANTVMQ